MGSRVPLLPELWKLIPVIQPHPGIVEIHGWILGESGVRTISLRWVLCLGLVLHVYFNEVIHLADELILTDGELRAHA